MAFLEHPQQHDANRRASPQEVIASARIGPLSQESGTILHSRESRRIGGVWGVKNVIR